MSSGGNLSGLRDEYSGEGAVSRFTNRGTFLMADANYIDDSRRKGVRGRVSVCGLVTYQEGENQLAKKLTIVLGVLAMVVLMTALPALAYGSDSGSINCGSNYIAVQSRTTMRAYVQVPNGTTVKTWVDGASPTDHTWATTISNPSWRVLSLEGDVYAAETYAYCYGQ